MAENDNFLTVQQILHLIKSGPTHLLPLVDIVKISMSAHPHTREQVEYLDIAHIGEHQDGHAINELKESLRMINILPHLDEIHPPS